MRQLTKDRRNRRREGTLWTWSSLCTVQKPHPPEHRDRDPPSGSNKEQLLAGCSFNIPSLLFSTESEGGQKKSLFVKLCLWALVTEFSQAETTRALPSVTGVDVRFQWSGLPPTKAWAPRINESRISKLSLWCPWVGIPRGADPVFLMTACNERVFPKREISLAW